MDEPSDEAGVDEAGVDEAGVDEAAVVRLYGRVADERSGPDSVSVWPAEGPLLHLLAAEVGGARGEIGDLLRSLPADFLPPEKGGMGGASFLRALPDGGRPGREGPFRTMALLLAMGEAAGLARPLVAKGLWHVLPRGLPYYVVDPDGLYPAAEPADVPVLRAWPGEVR